MSGVQVRVGSPGSEPEGVPQMQEAPRMNTVEIGKIGEMQAKRILEGDGYKVIEVNGAADLIAEKEGSKLSLNVKSGRNFLVASDNLERLIQDQASTPGLMFVGGRVSCVFTLSRIYQNPPVMITEVGEKEKEENGLDFTALSAALHLGECLECGFIVPRPFKSWMADGTRVSVWSCVCGHRWRTAEANR